MTEKLLNFYVCQSLSKGTFNTNVTKVQKGMCKRKTPHQVWGYWFLDVTYSICQKLSELNPITPKISWHVHTRNDNLIHNIGTQWKFLWESKSSRRRVWKNVAPCGNTVQYLTDYSIQHPKTPTFNDNSVPLCYCTAKNI